jgi:hypothetical protein
MSESFIEMYIVLYNNVFFITKLKYLSFNQS